MTPKKTITAILAIAAFCLPAATALPAADLEPVDPLILPGDALGPSDVGEWVTVLDSGGEIGILSGSCNLDGGTSSGDIVYQHDHLTWATWDHSSPTWSPAARMEVTVRHCETGVDTSGLRHVVYAWKKMQKIEDGAWNGSFPCRMDGPDHLDWRWDDWLQPDEGEWNLKLVVRPASNYQLLAATPEGDHHDSDGSGSLTISAFSGSVSVTWPFTTNEVAWYPQVQQWGERSWVVSRGDCSQFFITQFEMEQNAPNCSTITTYWRTEMETVHWYAFGLGHTHNLYWGTDTSMNTLSHASRC